MKKLILAILYSGLSHQMLAQTSVVIHDSLKEIRVFRYGSAEFIQATNEPGVANALAAFGESAQLIVAVRNDSGEPVESLRIVFRARKGERVTTHVLSHPRLLTPGAMALLGPPEFAGAVAALTMKPGQGLSAGPSPEMSQLTWEEYRGSEVTTSVDSASLATGLFIGPDTLGFFSRLVQSGARKRAFFSDVVALKETLAPEIKQILSSRGVAARSARQKTTGLIDLDLAALTESALCTQALMRLEQGGVPVLVAWAQQEHNSLKSKNVLHR